ncbi:MAG TPA: extracellular solute-binding protein [Spirochaetia bacterium]|nr:extracellular solute-binding protein [Spirochaetia bacterium]
MKRVIVIAAAVFVLMAAVAFASGGTERSATTSPAQTKLNVLYYIDPTQAGYAEDQAIWAKFEADNPDIKIEKEELFNEPFHDKVAAYIAAGTLPDVMYMWPSGRSTALHEKHLTKDLAPLLGKEFLSHFVPSAVDPNNQKAKYLAMLPQSVTYTSVMYTNKKMLTDNGLALPTTYADLKAMVPKLRSKGVQTVLMANKSTWVMQSCLFSTIVGRLLGDGWVDSAVAGKAKFTDPEAVGALRFVDSMYKDGVISPDTIQLEYGEGPDLFAQNKAAFLIDGDWRQGYFVTDKSTGKALIPPDQQASDYAFLNFPQIPGEKNPGITSAVVGVGFGISSQIPAGSAKEKAAVRWMQYYYSPEVMQIKLEVGSFIPSRKNVTSDKVDPFTAMMPKFYSTINKTSYVLDGALAIDVYTPLNNVLQEIGLGTKTPDQAAAEVQKALDDWRAKQSS